MKKIPMLLLLAAPYIFLRICVVKGLVGEVFYIWIGMCVLIYLPNMIYAFVLPRLNYSGRQLLFWNMFLKLLNIPVYLLIAFIVMLLHIFIIPMIPFLALFDYTLLLPSTMYGISGIWACYKKGGFSKTAMIVNIILQFLFCLDVFSAVYCYVRARKNGQI